MEELLDLETGWWDEQLVRDVFWEEDVMRILATPTNLGHEDFLAWHFDGRGLFSVKSAYHVLDDGKEKEQVRQEGQCSSGSHATENATSFWRSLWKLSCPPKLKHFLWRLTRNSLALKLNLQRRGIKLDTRCPVCNRLDEDGGHCFLKCKFVKHCWVDLQLEHVRLELLSKCSAREVVQAVLQLKEADQMKTIILLWKWWSVRNQFDHGERGLSGSEVVGAVLGLISDLTGQEKCTSNRTPRAMQRWNAPPPGKLKINSDGAFIYPGNT
jgi:hypothetical protein